MILIVGLTGGIGSGKSTVAKMFQEFNIPTYYTDIEAKKLMSNSKIIKRKLIKKFGKKTYDNNELNRPYLASLVFSNKENLAYLESVVHPKVNQHFKRWVKKQNAPYVLQENAILFENGSHHYCDYIIVVTAPKKIKIERVIKRDKTTKEEVLLRINNQWTDKQKIKKSDFVIQNTNIKQTKKDVNFVHYKLLSLIT